MKHWCAWEDQGIWRHGFIMGSSSAGLCVRAGSKHINLPPAKATLFETPDKAKKHAQKQNRKAKST